MEKPAKADVLQGTLDLMVLQTLDTLGPQHGYAIAARLEQVSSGALQLNMGTLYPALMRLEQRGLLKGSWGTTDDQPQGAVLRAHRRRPPRARQGEAGLGSHGRHHARAAARRGVRTAGPTRCAALREWIDRLLGTLRAAARRRRPRGRAAPHAELGRCCRRAPAAPRVAPAVTQAMDALRDRRGLPWLHALSADVVFGWRQLRRGIASSASPPSCRSAWPSARPAPRSGSSTRVLLRPLPIAAPDRLAFAVTWFVDAQQRLDYYDSCDYPTYTRYVGHGRRPGRPAARRDRAARPRSCRAARRSRSASTSSTISGNVFGVFGLQPAVGPAVRARRRSHAGRPPGRRPRLRLLAASLRRGSAGRRQSAAIRRADPRGDWRRARRVHRDRAGPRGRRVRAGADERRAARQARAGAGSGCGSGRAAA